ncbi:tyrosine-type recombinase/integrase [Phycicoccus jejuensis]|uniref:tyrosine-type recombinase/integrase n=1 Tax=Phycicoccus jejuensis TaxID=367299 RepID=UPI0004C3ECC4|nr:tyrosine-type recombinase/integrase [Phycicoccus jejuensis]
MSRPLTGSLKAHGEGWRASLPVARGSSKRRSKTFASLPQAQAWLERALAQLEATGTLADADPSNKSRGRHRFGPIAGRWADEYYTELQRGEADRELAVRRSIQRIGSFMDQRNLVMETMTREHVKALQMHLVSPQQPRSGAVPEGLDPRAHVTMSQACALPGMASRSTLKRRLADGELIPATRAAGADLFLVEDLYRAAGVAVGQPLRRGPRTDGRLTTEVARDVMWVFEQVCTYAADCGVLVPNDRTGLRMVRPQRTAPSIRIPVELSTCVRVAARLHVVHQATLWLTRVLGLRLGEAYGPRVRDVLPLGPGAGCALTIQAQDGRTFRRRDDSGKIHTATGPSLLKNEQSYRVLVAPPMLADLIEAIIATFHTNPDGTLRMDARLIPGLRHADSGGQSSFRAALTAAAKAEKINVSGDVADQFSLTPHDMRRALLSDLDRKGLQRRRVQRVAGHRSDGTVLARHYLLDDPALRPAREAADAVQAELESQLPHGLMIPTTIRCTTGKQPALAACAHQLDTELMERGWLVALDQDAAGELMLEPVAAATRHGLAASTVRRWARQGQVRTATRRDSAGRTRTVVSDADVESKARGAAVPMLAAELGVPYHQLYRWLREHDASHGRGGGALTLSEQDREDARAHFDAQAQLWKRAMPLSESAAYLRQSPAQVSAHIAAGRLVEDQRSTDGRRMVTRVSVEQLHVQCSSPAQRCLSVQQAASTLGVAARTVHDLIRAGRLERGSGRLVTVTASSVALFAARECPERLLGLASDGEATTYRTAQRPTLAG